MLIIIDLVRAVYEIKHTDVPQYLKKTAAVSDELKEANRRDAASNEWEKKKRKEETDDLLQRLPAGRYSPAKSGKCFDTFTQCGDDLLT